MFLSQLTLNPRSRQVVSECADSYQMHRTLCRAFGSKADLGVARMLYRVDTTQNGAVTVLVQSQLEPDWSYLDERGYLLRNAQCKPFAPCFETGQVLTFRLRANPVKADASQRVGERARGKRVGIYKESERRDWMLRQAARCGFTIPAIGETGEGEPVHDLRLTDEKVFRASPEGPDKRVQAALSAALFEGRLTVGDVDAFTNSLQNGIGPAKAFGFGLLSLRRA